jgi:uncharacterized membrane protein
MWAAVREEVRHLDTSRRALRNFGVVVGGVFVVIATVIAWRRGWSLEGLPLVFGVPGGLLVVAGLVVPSGLRRIYLGWMTLAVVMGYVMTRLILSVVFFLLMVPIGLALRLAGKDLLRLRRKPAGESYWLPRSEDAPLAERLRRYY